MGGLILRRRYHPTNRDGASQIKKPKNYCNQKIIGELLNWSSSSSTSSRRRIEPFCFYGFHPQQHASSPLFSINSILLLAFEKCPQVSLDSMAHTHTTQQKKARMGLANSCEMTWWLSFWNGSNYSFLRDFNTIYSSSRIYMCTEEYLHFRSYFESNLLPKRF